MAPLKLTRKGEWGTPSTVWLSLASGVDLTPSFANAFWPDPGDFVLASGIGCSNSFIVVASGVLYQIGSTSNSPDSGWVTPILGSSWTALGGGQTPQYRRQGDKVYLRGQYTPGGSSGTSPFTLPAGYWPSSPCSFPLDSATVVNAASLSVTTAGVITITYTATATAISQDGVFFFTD